MRWISRLMPSSVSQILSNMAGMWIQWPMAIRLDGKGSVLKPFSDVCNIVGVFNFISFDCSVFYYIWDFCDCNGWWFVFFIGFYHLFCIGYSVFCDWMTQILLYFHYFLCFFEYFFIINHISNIFTIFFTNCLISLIIWLKMFI